MRAVLVNGSSDFKFGDMTETFSIQCIDSGKVLSFDSTYTIELIMNFNDQIYNKVAGTILSDNTQVQFVASQFSNMPPREYLCEIQVTDKNGNISIFPDKGFFTVSINTSASNISGSVVSYITLANLLDGINSTK